MGTTYIPIASSAPHPHTFHTQSVLIPMLIFLQLNHCLQYPTCINEKGVLSWFLAPNTTDIKGT